MLFFKFAFQIPEDVNEDEEISENWMFESEANQEAPEDAQKEIIDMAPSIEKVQFRSPEVQCKIAPNESREKEQQEVKLDISQQIKLIFFWSIIE